jgi:hypothetical protein
VYRDDPDTGITRLSVALLAAVVCGIWWPIAILVVFASKRWGQLR